MKNINNKNGSTLATMPIILLVSMMLIIIVGTLIINNFMPFLWYQKMQNLMQKYMFVIEKFGYLTSLEKRQLYTELDNKGFNIEDIMVIAPETEKEYGELITFKIIYNYKNKKVTIKNGMFSFEEKTTPITVDMYSYSKK